MPKVCIVNGTDKAVKLAIEPWADVVVLAPREQADFEYDEPGDVEFCLRPDGGAAVSVMSDRLKYSANGREETWEDKTHFLSSHVTLREK
jgi:hypothetical protein